MLCYILKSKECVLISDAKGRTEILNHQYTSVFNPLNNGVIPTTPTHHPTLAPIIVTEEGVLTMLKNLKPNKAAGLDHISPHLLKELAVEVHVAPVLTHMFQFTMNSGTIPAQWKTANVVPVFKKDNCSKAANYQPVSFTSVCCKLNEHVIAKAIMNHLEENRILSDMQHGFHQAHSCEMQLVTFIKELMGPVLLVGSGT